MKKLILIILISSVLGTINTVAQTHRYYCEVKGIEKDFSSGLKIIFDFGTSESYSAWTGLANKLKFVDSNGQVINFHSMVDAANYMVERGWQFQQAYSSLYSGSPIIHWIFYKDAENMDKARENIITLEEYKRMQSQERQ